MGIPTIYHLQLQKYVTIFCWKVGFLAAKLLLLKTIT